MYILRKTPIAQLAILLIVGAQAGCSGIPAANAPAVAPLVPWVGTVESSRSGDVSSPITVKLILSKAPRLNEEADLTFIISSIYDAPGTQASLTLPEGAVLTSGAATWSGDVKANEPQVLSGRILFTTEGNKIIEAKALCDVASGDRWGDAAYIYLQVTQDAGYVGFPQSPNEIHPAVQQAGTPPAGVPQPGTMPSLPPQGGTPPSVWPQP